MKKMILAALATTFLAGIAHANFTEVPASKIEAYKQAALLLLKNKAAYCAPHGKAAKQQLTTVSFIEVIERNIRASGKVLLDKSATSPALIFQNSVNSEAYNNISVFTTRDQLNVQSIDLEMFESATINKGSIVEPVLAIEYVSVGALKACELR
jgi:hypothetical protein